MIVLLLNLVAVALNRMIAWLAAQSTPRLILLVQAVLLLVYLLLALAAYCEYGMASTFSCTLAMRVPVAAEKVWDHIQDVRKNPVSAKQHVRTTVLRSDHNHQEWHETIGSNEIIRCSTNHQETVQPTRLVRDCWADAVNMKGQLTYLLTTTETITNTTTSTSSDDDDSHANNKPSSSSSSTTTTTIVRLFVTVEAVWGSFLTPLLRLVLTYRQGILEHATQDYLELLCQDMGVPYQTAEAWE